MLTSNGISSETDPELNARLLVENNNLTIIEITKYLQATINEKQIPISFQIKFLEYFVEFTGFIIGVTSAYVVEPVSEAFGTKIYKLLSISNEDTQIAIQKFFGITSVIPMAALGGTNVLDSFSNGIKYFSRRTPSNNFLFSKKDKLPLRAAKAFFILASPISAIPVSTITWNHISASSNARVPVTTAAVIGPTFFNGRAGQVVLNKFKKLNPKMKLIQNHLQVAIKTIKTMPDEDFNKYSQRIIANDQTINSETLFFLFNPKKINFDSNIINHHDIKHSAISCCGFILGALAASVFYKLTIDGDKEPLHIDSTAIQIITAILSYTLNAALSASATQQAFESTYNWYQGKTEKLTWNKIRNIFWGVSLLFGFCAAVPIGELQIDAASNGSILQILLIIPAFLGPFCVRSKALEKLLNRIFDSIINMTSTISDTEKFRSLLTVTLSTFNEQLPTLSDEHLDKLSDFLIFNETLDRIDAPNELTRPLLASDDHAAANHNRL